MAKRKAVTTAKKRMKKSPVLAKQNKAKKMIALKLKEAMEAKNWKPTDLVAAMKKDNATLVYIWLSGTHNFTVNSLIELESALGVQLLADGLSAARIKRSARAKK